MRKSNTIRNLLTSVIPFFILTIFGFYRVNVFLDKLGIDIFSLNQLFFQLFAYISLAEGGIGALINQQYYKLIVNNDYDSINELYTVSKRLFNKISLIIMTLGIFLSFFLNYLTNNDFSLSFMQLVFIIFLIRALLEYITFSPRIVMQADQKMYKINTIYNIYRILEVIVEIVSLFLGANYIVILIITIFVRIIMYCIINRKVFKEYPWLETVSNPKNIKLEGIKDIMAIKLSGAAYDNTDVILISTFLNSLLVTVYSSYNYIIKFLNDFSYMLYSSILASFGNVFYKESEEYSNRIFGEINIVFLTLAVIFSTVTYCSINDFIKIWLSEEFLINQVALILLINVLFFNIIKKPFLIQRDAMGLFKETTNVNIIEAILSIVLSLALIKKLGITGVLLGKLVSNLITNFWYMPVLIYKKNIDLLRKYFLKVSYHFLLTCMLSFIGFKIYDYLNISNIFVWIIYTSLFFCLVFLIVIILQYMFFEEFRVFTIQIKKHFLKGDKNEESI